MGRISVFFTVLMFSVLSFMFCGCGNSFGDYRNICFDSDDDSIEHSAAVEMAKMAESFGEWSTVNACAKYGSELKNTAAHKMFGLAVTSDEFLETYQRRDDDTALADAARLKMFDIANVSGTFNDWHNAATASNYANGFMFCTSLGEMAKKAVTADDWTDVFATSPANSPYRPMALQKLNKLTPSFSNWFLVAIETHYGEDKISQTTFQMAVVKMFETAESYHDWKWVYEFAPDGSHTQELAFQKMVELK